MWPFSPDFASKRRRGRRGRLVSWVEKANLEHIRRLLEITEAESNHELLLSMKNLWELGASPFHYIVLVIPRPLSAEPVKGEHFVIADLFKSIPSSSSQAGSAQVKVAKGALVKFVQPDQIPLAEQDPYPAPQVVKKKKKKKKTKASLARMVNRPRLPTWD